jgi:lipoprotein-releasing system ATP-binding protein
LNILTVKNLKKSYLEAHEVLTILRGIDLQIEEGETVSITGQSGSGKSTLLHLIGLLDKPDSGEIYYYDKKIHSQSKQSHQFRNERIGFVFQFHHLLQDFTAEENVALPMFLKSNNLAESLQKARELLAAFDLLPRKNHYPNQLSGGEQQRVCISRALINSPDILLADEPTGNLDEQHSDDIIELLIELNKTRNQSMIIVTHNKQIAAKLKTHYHLENGLLHLQS